MSPYHIFLTKTKPALSKGDHIMTRILIDGDKLSEALIEASDLVELLYIMSDAAENGSL